MPIYMEISRLHRTVTIVARGKIAAEEIYTMAQRLADAHVRPFAKILEVAGAKTEWTEGQIAKIAELLRRPSDEKRGPVAFIIDPDRIGFPHAFAKMTAGDGPISLFKSLHEARDWLQRIEHVQTPPHPERQTDGATAGSGNETPWSDPHREGLLIRGRRQRGIRIKSVNAW